MENIHLASPLRNTAPPAACAGRVRERNMQHGIRDDAALADPWQIDPVTARIRAAEALRDPTIVVVEATPSLSLAVAEICHFLHVGIVTVPEPLLVPALLAETRPIAILHEASSLDFTIYDLLMVVAGYDTGLPVLVVLPPDPECRGALDAAQRLWELTELVQHSERPGIRQLIDFMFHAGRKYGRTRFMPI